MEYWNKQSQNAFNEIIRLLSLSSYGCCLQFINSLNGRLIATESSVLLLNELKELLNNLILLTFFYQANRTIILDEQVDEVLFVLNQIIQEPSMVH
jgi:hypothetical protein